MKNKIAAVNKRLEQSLGAGIVRLMPCSKPGTPYMLRFADENPSERTIRAAKLIVGKMMPTKWKRREGDE